MEKTFKYRNYVTISLSAINNNIASVRRLIGSDCKLLTVLKGDGYGHGAAGILTSCEKGSDWYGVATFDEALMLRKAGTEKPILVFGWVPYSMIPDAVEKNITLNIISLQYARELNARLSNCSGTLMCHIEIDTGLGRTGLRCLCSEELDNVVQSFEEIFKLENLCVKGIYTHFSACDSEKESDLAYTKAQYKLYQNVCNRLKEKGINLEICHCLNSVGILKYSSEWKNDMVRAGRVIYGIGMDFDTLKQFNLKPALSWFARIIDIKSVESGEYIGYGRTFKAEGKMKVAILSVGYGDGYKQIYSNNTYVEIAGEKAPSVGKISMDSMAVDITHIEDVHIGDWALLLGESPGSFIPTMMFTATGGTNSEVMLSLTERVPRLFVE